MDDVLASLPPGFAADVGLDTLADAARAERTDTPHRVRLNRELAHQLRDPDSKVVTAICAALREDMGTPGGVGIQNSDVVAFFGKSLKKHPQIGPRVREVIRPPYSDLLDRMEATVKAEPAIRVVLRTKWTVSFVPVAWDGLPSFYPGASWRDQLVYFWIGVTEHHARLIMEMTLGPQALRRRVYDMARAERQLFNSLRPTLSSDWCRMFRRDLVPGPVVRSQNTEEAAAVFTRNWNRFLESDLPRLTDGITRALSQT